MFSISIHAPTRGATDTLCQYTGLTDKFQSTLPQGERPYIQNLIRHFAYFNPRSHKGSDRNAATGHIKIYNFNPRSHKGSDKPAPVLSSIARISIHAPTRGATYYADEYIKTELISIHAPTRGATVSKAWDKMTPDISIHAPTRGATRQRWYRRCPRYFNPRSHKGSDYYDPHISRHFSYFNPRSHKGSDALHSGHILSPSDFNPRSHKGSDIIHRTHTSRVSNFNPRSHKGSDSNFTQNSISVLFHFYQSFPHIIFPHTARFRLLIIFCTFFLVRIAQGFPVCFHFAPKQYLAFYNVCSTDLL